MFRRKDAFKSVKSLRAFTLIELLVVIAIIGILSSVVLASMAGSRQRGRDAKRISDLKQIQLALESYYNDNQMYPWNIYQVGGSVPPNVGLSPNYMATVPTDPGYSVTASQCATNQNQAGCYGYVPYGYGGSNRQTCNGTGGRPNPTSYHLGAVFEQTTNQALTQDADYSVSTFNSNGFFTCNNNGYTAALTQGDFDGTSAVTGTSLCSATAGTAQPGGGTSGETCYDLVPGA
ncbi:MAG: type II secretion system protein [Patescibacteria group bacterium]|nr:type II secretion system protein [Patescibacteria group bacterium]